MVNTNGYFFSFLAMTLQRNASIFHLHKMRSQCGEPQKSIKVAELLQPVQIKFIRCAKEIWIRIRICFSGIYVMGQAKLSDFRALLLLSDHTDHIFWLPLSSKSHSSTYWLKKSAWYTQNSTVVKQTAGLAKITELETPFRIRLWNCLGFSSQRTWSSKGGENDIVVRLPLFPWVFRTPQFLLFTYPDESGSTHFHVGCPEKPIKAARFQLAKRVFSTHSQSMYRWSCIDPM